MRVSIWNCEDELFDRICEEINQTLKRYEKFPAETRFLMLVDKLIILLTFSKTAMTLEQQNEFNNIERDENLTDQEKQISKQKLSFRINSFSSTFDLLKKELFALEEFIQSDTKSILNKMENKLDEVLLGPYYTSGKELMENAKNEFNDLSSTLN